MSRREPGPLRRTLRIVRPELRGQRTLTAGGMLALLGEVCFRILEPWPIKWVIDAVSVSLGAEVAGIGGAGATMPLLLGCAGALLAIVGMRALAAYLSTVQFAIVGSEVATALRARVFAHVQSLSMRYHATAPAGDTVQRLVGDVGRLQEVAVTAGLPLVGNIVTLLVLLVVLVLLDPLMAAIVAGAALAYLLVSRGSTKRITAASRTTRKGEGALADTAAESLGAMRVVQAYGLQSTVARRFQGGNDRALREGVKAKRLAARLERGTDVIVGVATALVLLLGGWRVSQGALTPGDLVIFVMYLKIAMRPLKDMAKFTGRIARAAASGERVADLLDERADIVDAPHAKEARIRFGAIEFDDVTVRHGRSTVLDGLRLRIAPGEHVCLLGASGAGKSTLASLIPRMLDPVAGTVRIDGDDLRDLRLQGLRGQVSLLLQESVLFATSVRQNIRYGRLDASDEEVERAARDAEAHAFIAALPDGYDTRLGARGDTLSGGQRQRIAIARALLRDAPVVVLDEATTGLDPEARAQVAASLARLTEGRTTVAITHDPATVRGADRVLWLEDGRIAEDGRPAELLEQPGSRFARWFHGAEEGADVEGTVARPPLASATTVPPADATPTRPIPVVADPVEAAPATPVTAPIEVLR